MFLLGSHVFSLLMKNTHLFYVDDIIHFLLSFHSYASIKFRCVIHSDPYISCSFIIPDVFFSFFHSLVNGLPAELHFTEVITWICQIHHVHIFHVAHFLMFINSFLMSLVLFPFVEMLK